MTNQELRDFISRKCFSLMLGTRNNDLQPAVQRAFGVKASEDFSHISFFIPKSLSEQTLANLKENGRAAGTAVDIGTHQTLQFKGEFVSCHDCNDSDMQEFYANMTGFGGFIEKFFGAEALAQMQAFNILPLVSITFKIQDIFNQTPGPGTGQKIN